MYIVEHRILTYLCSLDNHQKVGWKTAGTNQVLQLFTSQRSAFLEDTGHSFSFGKGFVEYWELTLNTWGTFPRSHRYSEPQVMVLFFTWMCLCGSRHLLSLSHCHVCCHWCCCERENACFTNLEGSQPPLCWTAKGWM